MIDASDVDVTEAELFAVKPRACGRMLERVPETRAPERIDKRRRQRSEHAGGPGWCELERDAFNLICDSGECAHTTPVDRRSPFMSGRAHNAESTARAARRPGRFPHL